MMNTVKKKWLRPSTATSDSILEDFYILTKALSDCGDTTVISGARIPFVRPAVSARGRIGIIFCRRAFGIAAKHAAGAITCCGNTNDDELECDSTGHPVPVYRF